MLISNISLYLIMFIIMRSEDIFTGGQGGPTDILQFNITSYTWEEVGQMKKSRYEHAVSVIADVDLICP